MSALVEMIAGELARPVPPGAHALAARLRERFGPTLRAVLMYGSNLRQDDDREGVVDLYALVGSYAEAYTNPALRFANRVLPPNVFYLEAGERPVVRCKYAVLELAGLARLTSPTTSEPYFWARFAQPCALVWASDEAARTEVAAALAGAVTTFVAFAVPFAPDPFDARTLWTSAWRATYGAEVRPERPGASEAFFDVSAERFTRATALALPALPWAVTPAGEGYRVALPPVQRTRLLRAWRHRRLRAKSLFVLRIIRNGLIFEGGVDYAMWKIQRHSGVAIDHGWRRKRYPLLALGAEAWRLYRARAFR